MRVLMLGWDFSPRLSGGVGSACQGLATALTRAEGTLACEVLFVLPRLHGDEEAASVELLGTDARQRARARQAERMGRRALAAVAVREAVLLHASPAPPMPAPPPLAPPPPAPTAPVAASEPPTLPSPEESLRLLTLASPLRPYLSPADYAALARVLLPPAPRPPAPEVIRAPAKPPPSAPALVEPVAHEPALRADLPEPEPTPPADVVVPPYGATLSAEIERYARAALALVEDEPFDVIHAHDWMTFPAALLIQEQRGKPLVVHFHTCEPERRASDPAPEARVLEQAALERAERVVCVSEASARTLRAHYGFEPAKLRVLHNAFEPVGTAARRPRRTPTVLYLGRLSEQKSPDVFLRAAARIHAVRPEVRFVLAGEGTLYPELQTLVEELGLERVVRFTGFVGGAERAELYAAADVYVLSSSQEPFGISALEALALGVPTIVPQGAGVGEVVRSVLRFEPGDAVDLADKTVALLERPGLRQQLSRAGLAEVRKLRWDRPARALRGLYDEIVRSTP